MKTDKNLAKKFFQNEVDDYKKEFYESGYRTFMSVRLEAFLKEIDALNLSDNIKSLDAGCGPGYLASAMQDRKYDVTALDSSSEMLRLTESLIKKKQSPDLVSVNTIKGDIESLPFDDEEFNLVGSAGVLEYLPTDDKMFKEFYRILKPSGKLILSSTNKVSPAGYIEPIIEGIKRNEYSRNACNWMLNKLGSTPVRAREFSVRKHTKKQFVENLQMAGFKVDKIGYFYALPFPHPFDRIFPRFSNFLGVRLEFLRETPLKYLLEGIYAVATK